MFGPREIAKLAAGNVGPRHHLGDFLVSLLGPSMRHFAFYPRDHRHPSMGPPPPLHAHRHRFCTRICINPGMPPTKWSCTTRSDAGDGDAQNSCEITVLAFQTFRQNILSLICMYIYVVCLSDSQLTQCRNFGLHGLPKKFTHVHQFSCIHVWVWHSTHKCSPFQK